MFKKSSCKINNREALLVEGLGGYDLGDTMECGQCFRYERIDGTPFTEYQTIVGDTIVRVGQRMRGELIFYGMDDECFERVARRYFSLDLSLAEIKADVLSNTKSDWLKNAADCAEGIAILSQDPWEALISFIISQNNNIPRIRKIIRMICAEYGVNLSLQNGYASCPLGIVSGTPCEEKCKECGRCYTFPSPDDILCRPEGLLPSHPGFRYKYILSAAEMVARGDIDLDEIRKKASYDYTVMRLKEICGVGDKVASCVALFGFGNLEAFPIDVWMRRAIDSYFGGSLDPATLGRYAGVAQQYIFHYIRNLA